MCPNAICANLCIQTRGCPSSNQGIHPKVVSEMLGHSSVQPTLDTYSHVTPTMQQEAAKTMDSILTGNAHVIGRASRSKESALIGGTAQTA